MGKQPRTNATDDTSDYELTQELEAMVQDGEAKVCPICNKFFLLELYPNCPNCPA